MEDDEYDKITRSLTANADKDFVRRILDPAIYPVLQNEGGGVSTHSMANSEADGRYFSYPTVVRKGGDLVRLGGREAIDHAKKTGEYIEFPSDEEALNFSKNYKKYWERIGFKH